VERWEKPLFDFKATGSEVEKSASYLTNFAAGGQE
jgi:hypothetical protein